MKTLFLDESGDHSLEKIDPQYPVFVLAGAVFDQHYYDTTATRRVREMKRKLFGGDEIVLHTADIYRNKGVFEKLKARNFRSRFYKSINEMIHSLEFEVIACGILKKRHLEWYGLSAFDPYSRFDRFSKTKNGARYAVPIYRLILLYS